MASEIRTPLTLADARNLLGGYVPQDTDFETAINEALERIYSEGIWDGGTERVDLSSSITDEILTLPYEYDAMLAIAIDGNPVPIMGKQHEFTQAGPGVEDAGEGGAFVIDLGFEDAAAGNQVHSIRKYKILQDITSTTEVEGIMKLRFRFLVADTQLVIPGNIGALKHALLAVVYENEGDIQRSTAYWDECYAILQSSKQTNRAGVITPNTQQQWGFMTGKPHAIV